MKYIKSYILFVIMGFAVAGCTIDDLKDDVNDLKDRVTLIEQQVKLLNDNLAVIGYILDPQNKTVSWKQLVRNMRIWESKVLRWISWIVMIRLPLKWCIASLRSRPDIN